MTTTQFLPKEDPIGRPICILELRESPQHLSQMRFNQRETESILSLAGDLPFAILTISGEARQGKSYFLSCLINYLECLQRGESPSIGLYGNKSHFPFQNGMERLTTGVWMWSRPFVLEDGTAPFALFVMDTQGKKKLSFL